LSFQLSKPILIVGLGGAGSKLAIKAKESINADCLLISNDQKDLSSDCSTIEISTKPILNPSVQLIRGFTNKSADEITNEISKYSTVIMMANLAGKAGSAIAPVVSHLSKEHGKNLISFAIMPFKFEKDRIFTSGISLKRIRNDSDCTIVLDNNALLESNPDLKPDQCYDITNAAVMHVVNSLNTSSIPEETNILSTSKENDFETSLRDSLKMLYENAPPNSIKSSILYVLGGNNAPIGMLNSITNIASGVLSEEGTRIEISTSSGEESKVVMLSSIQGETRFDKYDPLGIIPQEDTLDWNEPECSFDCKLDFYQLE